MRDMALRFDKTKLDDPRRDHNGYLVAGAHATRTGVFTYHHPDGTTTLELRHPNDVFNADSIKTLKNRPLTFNHPAAGKVDSNNTKQLAVGHAVDEPTKNDIYLDTQIQITDEAAIERVLDEDKPVRELSCGYEAEVIPETGTYNGEKYDHRQTNIEYNHIALVGRGRAGPQVRLQLDAADAAEDEELVKAETTSQTTSKSTPKPRGDTDMIEIRRDAIEIRGFKQDKFTIEIKDDSIESGKKAVEDVLIRLDAATAYIAKGEADKDKLQGRIDALRDTGKVNLDALNEMVKERQDVVNAANYLGLTDFSHLETDEIQKAVVIKAFPAAKIDEMTKDHIQGRYDTIIEGIEKEHGNLEALQALRGRSPTERTRGRFPLHKDELDLDPRDQLHKDTSQMWKSKAERATG